MTQIEQKSLEYDAALKLHHDRYYQGVKNTRAWQVIAFVGLAFGLCGLGFGVWTSVHKTFVPYVVEVDDAGKVRLAKTPTRLSAWPDHVIKREVRDFIERIRSIPGDTSVIKNNLRRAFLFMRDQDASFRKISEVFSEKTNNPLIISETVTVSVEINSINAVSDSTYRLEWKETRYERKSGRYLSEQKFIGTVILGTLLDVTREELVENPTGLHILDLDIVKDL